MNKKTVRIKRMTVGLHDGGERGTETRAPARIPEKRTWTRRRHGPRAIGPYRLLLQRTRRAAARMQISINYYSPVLPTDVVYLPTSEPHTHYNTSHPIRFFYSVILPFHRPRQGGGYINIII